MALRELLHYMRLGLYVTVPLLIGILIAAGVDTLVPGFMIGSFVVLVIVLCTVVLGVGIEALRDGQS